MRVLFIGGTGNISIASTRLLAERGVELDVCSTAAPSDVASVPGGVRLRATSATARPRGGCPAARSLTCLQLARVRRRCYLADIRSLLGKNRRQYVVHQLGDRLSQASPRFRPVEEAPLGNPGWPYANNKILCEELLRASDFPSTIVRPSYTYGESWLPTALEGIGWTIVDRLQRGKPAIVPGDGESLWTMTHNSDFARALVGLLGNEAAVGESFHITSDEVLTWNQITETIARAAGVEPRIVHIPSDFVASVEPEIGIELLCDKAFSLVFDNAKIKRFVPGFEATVRLADGVARSVAWLGAHPEHKVIDDARSAALDRIVAAYRR